MLLYSVKPEYCMQFLESGSKVLIFMKRDWAVACVCLSLAVMSSCTNSKEREGITEIDVRLKQDVGANVPFHYSEMIDSIQFISLDSDIVGYVNDIKYCNGKYYLLSRSKAEIFVFDSSGDVISRVGRQGRANNEYVSVTAFDINPANNEVSIYDVATRRIVIFSSSGEYVRSIYPEISVFRDFSISAHGDYFVYTPDYMNNSPRGLWQLDCEGKIKEMKWTVPENFRLCILRTSPPIYFSRLSDFSLSLLGELNDNIVFEIGDNGDVAPKIQYLFDVKISNQLRQVEVVKEADALDKSFFYIHFYAETDRWSIMAVWYQSKIKTVFYDKLNHMRHVVANDFEYDYDVNGCEQVTILRGAGDRFLGLKEDENGLQSLVIIYLK